MSNSMTDSERDFIALKDEIHRLNERWRLYSEIYCIEIREDLYLVKSGCSIVHIAIVPWHLPIWQISLDQEFLHAFNFQIEGLILRRRPVQFERTSNKITTEVVQTSKIEVWRYADIEEEWRSFHLNFGHGYNVKTWSDLTADPAWTEEAGIACDISGKRKTKDTDTVWPFFDRIVEALAPL